VRAGAQGIGFAIPIDKVLGVVSTLVEEQAGSQRRYGIELEEDTNSNGDGLTVKTVRPDSLAKQAGLEAGDRIVRINDEIVRRPFDFHRKLLGRTSGETLQLAIERGGESVDLELAVSGASSSTATGSSDWHDLAWESLGVELEPVPSDVFRRKFRTRYRGGLTVQRVRPGSPAADQGIRAGDILVGMHIWETITMKNVAYIMSRDDFEEFTPVKFYILRDNDVLYGHLPVSMKPTQQR
jgi:serine protease Do